jgi:hypothetical protein
MRYRLEIEKSRRNFEWFFLIVGGLKRIILPLETTPPERDVL